jgi:hypothetical protein
MVDDTDDKVMCRSYTSGRRYPLTLGRVGGFTLPTQLSPSQIAVGLGSFAVLLTTREVWGLALPGSVEVITILAGPCAAAWAVRHLRMEGRSPVQMLIGLVTLWLSPPHGWCRGEARWSTPRPVRVHHKLLIVPTPTPIPASTPGSVVSAAPALTSPTQDSDRRTVTVDQADHGQGPVGAEPVVEAGRCIDPVLDRSGTRWGCLTAEPVVAR